MAEVCANCGLPKDICACETIAREEEKIKVSMSKKRFGKAVTSVEGISKDVDVKDVLKTLKTKLACGGALKNGIIVIQGDHRKRIKEILNEMGFPSSMIEIY